MDISEYKRKVIDLFKSGKATDEQWQQMAEMVLFASENDCEAVCEIDGHVYGECPICREPLYDGECCPVEFFSPSRREE
jgi:hypothetical protein